MPSWGGDLPSDLLPTAALQGEGLHARAHSYFQLDSPRMADSGCLPGKQGP